mgnify:FL=1|jgi:hypothetical protein
MAITRQPADDSFYSAYSQISVETDDSTSGLEIETQNFDEANMISLNIIDNEASEVIDNSGGTNNYFYKAFPIFRKMIAGEWYAFRVGIGVSSNATEMSVSLYQGTASGVIIGGTEMATTNLAIGSSMTWRFQVRTDLAKTGPTTVLLVYAGAKGATAGVKVTLNNMSLAYGKNFIGYSPSSVMAANSLTESIDIHRDSGFGTTKKYDLSFLAKAGFRDDRLRTFPYINPLIGFAIDYSLISAYAYRGIGEQDFKVRYASRGVRPRGHNVNFSQSNVGLALTDRTPDSDRNLYVKKYYGYPYFVTLFPKGAGGLTPATPIDVRVKITGASAETQFDISSRLNIPLVYEFDDELSDGADYVKLRPSGGVYPHQAWNIMFMDTEVPCNPFYIRWINQKGGWDTYMFEQHKKYTQEVDRGDQYVLANSRDPYASQTRGELAPEFKNIVQAGAEQLDENDFNLLKGIALSPLVQVYNYIIGSWQRVLVDDTDLTWDTKTPRNTVSYEFQLIDEQTQW